MPYLFVKLFPICLSVPSRSLHFEVVSRKMFCSVYHTGSETTWYRKINREQLSSKMSFRSRDTLSDLSLITSQQNGMWIEHTTSPGLATIGNIFDLHSLLTAIFCPQGRKTDSPHHTHLKRFQWNDIPLEFFHIMFKQYIIWENPVKYSQRSPLKKGIQVWRTTCATRLLRSVMLWNKFCESLSNFSTSLLAMQHRRAWYGTV
jgi:hypothetical protein